MPVINVNGRGVHVQEMNKGAAETVLLVHGMFSNLSVYYFHIAPLIAHRFHVILYDMKSHGMSERAKDGYHLQAMAEELLALLDVLQVHTVHLAGYSYGGLVALKTAICFPQRVKKLAVIEGPDPGDQETLDIIDVYSKEFLVEYINNFTDTSKVRMGKRQLERNHRMYQYLFNETSIRKDMQSEAGFFEGTAINAILQQTLLLYGATSNCIGAGYRLQGKIPHAQLLLVEGDHNVPVQQPAEVGKALKAFFEQVQPN